MAHEIEIRGSLHGLNRKIGKIGGEHIVFAITTRDLEKWNQLVGVTEGEVAIRIEAAQGDLGLENDDREEHREGMNGGEKPKRAPKVPTGRHAPAGDEQRE